MSETVVIVLLYYAASGGYCDEYHQRYALAIRAISFAHMKPPTDTGEFLFYIL